MYSHANDQKQDKLDKKIIHLNSSRKETTAGPVLNQHNGFRGIIGRHRKMLEVYEQIQKVSRYDYPVQIFGETGTGKELVAKAIHSESDRRDGPFVPVNCGALPEGLVESELFGHEKGSFTSANRHKKGRFELADGGTIFLDEVAELSKYMQVKLLRVLQEGKFERVGGEKTLSSNVRVISASNKELKREMSKNKFRPDLYYRLNVVPIDLPPLNRKKSDIPSLVEHFLNMAFRQYPHQNKLLMTEDAMMMLMEYAWPGNVRELQNTLQYACVQSNGEFITANDLPFEIQQIRQFDRRRGPSKKLDVHSVKHILKKTGGNKTEAAKQLGVGRATLYRFFDEFPEFIKMPCASHA